MVSNLTFKFPFVVLRTFNFPVMSLFRFPNVSKSSLAERYNFSRSCSASWVYVIKKRFRDSKLLILSRRAAGVFLTSAGACCCVKKNCSSSSIFSSSYTNFGKSKRLTKSLYVSSNFFSSSCFSISL